MIRLFVKPFSYPKIYFSLKELLARLPETHIVKPMVAAEFHRKEQGLIGEKSVLYYLEMLSETKYYIFHNLRLKYKHRFFQMDYLILCSAFALILEVKDITGDLHFDKNFNQMIVVKKTSKKKRKNPVLQASIQAWKLKGWLKENHIPEIPIHYLFVNANEDSELVTVPGNEQTAKKIVNSEGLLDKIEQIANYYTMDSLETKTIKKLCKLLLSSDTPEDPDVLKEFHLSPKDLISGVQCSNCDSFPMKYIYGTWHCSNCPYTSKTAHIPTIETYFLLIKPWITNSELREFIKISSPKTAHRILNSMDLEHKGTLKGRIYYPKHNFFPQIMHKNPNNNKK
jgi:hypothetical protein